MVDFDALFFGEVVYSREPGIDTREEFDCFAVVDEVFFLDWYLCCVGAIEHEFEVGENFIHIVYTRVFLYFLPELCGFDTESGDEVVVLHGVGREGAIEIVGDCHFYCELFSHGH